MEKYDSRLPDAVDTAPRGRGRPRAFDRDVALTRAMKLFWVKGYEATSIADLTEALGIGVKSLYAAFGSKDELYAEALRCYSATYEHLVLGRFREAATARDAVRAYLLDSAAAMTGSDCDLPHGCMATLGTVGSESHAELELLMRRTRGGAFDVLAARLEQAVAEGELPESVDVAKLARFVQTVQSGMAIRARDGADRAELQASAELAMAGWDEIVASARRH
ncbi:TetR/AcrR family transcriptional regulator [Sphingomonas turrisvirgatae]|uniref:TetR family transcriptional regulator n=1 Tax=Sphingomonas turrisvirgatae TaxID=1888892 RepID=A0A1E3LZ59_9SPHN|nr:TetR/AcrR family transcriptional regulator [Sphingomonas turrisvirgatae]ODP38999.1 TetR family transcriptional regulator [Sphingomonas turrisvirgatae]